MNALRRNQDRVANSPANANTTGYKRDRFFTEALNERLDAQDVPRSDRRVRQANDMFCRRTQEHRRPPRRGAGQGLAAA